MIYLSNIRLNRFCRYCILFNDDIWMPLFINRMKSFTSAMEALSSCGKNGGIILLIVVFFILSIGGSALGFEEEILSFYPAFMPFYIRNGIYGALSAASIYFGSIDGNMFSTFNLFGTVIGSYFAGVNFNDGIAFRIVAFF